MRRVMTDAQREGEVRRVKTYARREGEVRDIETNARREGEDPKLFPNSSLGRQAQSAEVFADRRITQQLAKQVHGAGLLVGANHKVVMLRP